MILVTGATGHVGYHLMEALADKRADVTAMVRVEAEADDLPGTPEHVVATLDGPPPTEVLQRFDQIFLLSPEIEEQAALETVFIDAIAVAGHRPHIVKIAPDGFQDPDVDVRFMLSAREVAQHLDALELPVTYLASALYMEDFLASAETIRRTGTIAAPAGKGKVGWVATADVAQAAAEVLTTPGHENSTYVLTGPEALGYRAVAHRFSEVFAWQVDYEDVSPQQARELMLASGLTPWQADGNLERFEWIREGGAATTTSTVRDLTGTDPSPLTDWLSDSRETFQAPDAL